jgi:hypothetical protein
MIPRLLMTNRCPLKKKQAGWRRQRHGLLLAFGDQTPVKAM